MKILIAEDEQRARIGLRDLIRSLGGDYEVIGEASNGQKALEMINALKPDVVFTDIKMPYMSGLSLVNAAKEQKSRARFVLVSAYAEFEYAKEALSLGVDDYLLKPPTKAELMKTLNNLEHIIKYGTRTLRNDSLKEQYPDANPIIRDVLDIIETGYAGNLNQQEIALKLGVSPEYLSYLFAKNIGKPFSKFVREYRIETACSLLKSGQTLPRDIPYQVGFSDAKYFAKVFHEVTGESLADFTRNLG